MKSKLLLIYLIIYSPLITGVLVAQTNDCREAESAKSRLDGKAQSIVQKEREIFIGYVCSQCNRPASKIWSDEHVSFPQHLQSVHGIPIASTLTKYRATQQMQGDYDELGALERIYKTYSDRCGSATIQREDGSKESAFNKTLKNDKYVSYTGQPGEANAVIPKINNSAYDLPEDPQLEVTPEYRVSEEELEKIEYSDRSAYDKMVAMKGKVNIWFKEQLAKQDLEEYAWNEIYNAAPNELVRNNLKTIKEFCSDEIVTKASENIERCINKSEDCDQLSDQIQKAPATLAHITAKNHIKIYKKITEVYSKSLLNLERWTR